MSDHNGACSSLFGGSCDCQAALPRHWLATTDHPRPDDHPAPTSQGGAASGLSDVMWLTRPVIIVTGDAAQDVSPGWVSHGVLQAIRDQHPAALSLTDPHSLAHHALPDCWPFDANPPAKTPATNGYIWCDACDSVQEAKGHKCEGPTVQP